MPLTHIKAINHFMHIERKRQLVFPGEVYVKKGDRVHPETIIAKTELDTTQPLRVQVAKYFELASDRIKDVLTVRVGDSVRRGEEIATYKKNVMTKRKSLSSPYSGVIEHISLSRGEIMIREKYSEDDAVVVINVAEQLGISPFFLKTFLHVHEGQDVTYNQVLASSDGMVMDAIRSPARGKVERIDTRSGTVSIRRPYSPVYVYGYIGGTVKEVLDKQGAIIETSACYIEGVFGVGGETFGELSLVTDTPREVITAEMISELHADKIIIGGAGITYEGMLKAQQMHVRGVIVGGMKNSDIVRLVGKEISVGITGQEEMDFSLIATEGFGHIPMLEKTFELLKAHVGKVASMNGTTQIRAGVIRPEIIIPLGDQVVNKGDTDATLVEARCGMKVRLICEPYYGQWGIVIADGSQKLTMPNGTIQQTVRVKLEDGQELNVGENNLLVYEVS